MRVPTNFALSLAALLFGMLVLVPSSGWASMTKNCPTEPATNVPIVSGETYWGTNCATYTTGDVDSFVFNASAGDTWTVVLGLASSPVAFQNTCLTIYAPGSTTPLFPYTCTSYGYYNGTLSVAPTLQLPNTGLYTIVVQGTADATIGYGLSVERLNPAPPDGVALTLAKSVTGEVTPPTAQDAYTFYGDTTGTYLITASLPSPVAFENVCFQVYSAGTSVLGPTCTSYGYYNGVTSVSGNLTPTVDGTYVVVISAAGNDTTVNYNLELSCLLGMCGVKPPPCSLTDALSYASGTLTMNFTLGAPYATTWNAWLIYGNNEVSLLSQSEPVNEPPIKVTETYSLGQSGVVGVLSTLTTPTKGIACSSWKTVNTGTAASSRQR
jgi:hypothetical protein